MRYPMCILVYPSVSLPLHTPSAETRDTHHQNGHTVLLYSDDSVCSEFLIIG